MNIAAHLLDDSSLLQRLQSRLRNSSLLDSLAMPLIAGVDVTQQAEIAQQLPANRIPAAVLVPIVRRDELTILLTQRAAHLRNHAGQISFPGGRIEAQDADAIQTALRETEEEIGLSRQHVQVLGCLSSHFIFTGYCVTPIVALVHPTFNLEIDTNEVKDVFEVPLKYVLNPINHQARERQIGDITVRVYDLPYGERHIWGATAGILMNLYRLLNQ